MTKGQNFRGYCYFSIVGWLFLFCCITEKELAENGNIIWNARFTAWLAAICIVGGTLLGSAVFFLLSLIPSVSTGSVPQVAKNPLPRKTVFLLSWILIVLCWLPAYLAYYPAICSYDITIQLEQITGGYYIDHHPLLHTMMIKGFMTLGEKIASVNLGIGLYALIQMLSLAAVFSAGVMLVYRYVSKKIWPALLLLYCCCFPFHAYMSISVTKDTIFSLFFLAQSLCLWLILHRGAARWKPGIEDCLYVITGIGMLLFRNNGKYAMLVLMVALLISLFPNGKRRKLFFRVTAETFLSFAAGNLLLIGIFAFSHAAQGDKREMLSLPIQQLARTYVYHGGVGLVAEDTNTLSEEDKALINDFILNQAYLEYRPDIADPVKRYTNTYVVRYRTKDFLRTYLGLFRVFPGDYLNAALAVNAGYLYPGDKSHALINVNGMERGMGYIQTRWVDADLNENGIYKDSKWEWMHEKLETFADDNAYLQIPLLKYIMVPGVYLWFWLLLGAWLLSHKQYKYLLSVALVFGYYITLFLGPTVQMRYLYPLMITLPFMTVLLTAQKKEFQEGSTCAQQ